jgi:flagellar biosynthesis protein FlhB
MLAPKRLKPDLKKINPHQRVQEIRFSLRILVDLFKNLGKLVVVGGWPISRCAMNAHAAQTGRICRLSRYSPISS